MDVDTVDSAVSYMDLNRERELCKKNKHRVRCTTEGPRNICYSYGVPAPASFNSQNETEIWSKESFFLLDNFFKDSKINILELEDDRVVFELKNVDVAIANAIRRILIAEVPTAAIETVQIWQNTGVIPDEVLAHRLCLIPFRVDAKKLKFKDESRELNEENALRFSLHIKCTENDLPPNQDSLPVYARQMIWEPLSERQKELFKDEAPVPVHPDILITKLRPGQEIELKAFLEKGIGRTHAKWSPVATAVYRLEPEFKFDEPITGEDAMDLKNICPLGVFDIEDQVFKNCFIACMCGKGGKAYARYPRRCTTCRACLERFEGKLHLNKISDHFIFSIESTGVIPAKELFYDALRVLRKKAITSRQILRTRLVKS